MGHFCKACSKRAGPSAATLQVETRWARTRRSHHLWRQNWLPRRECHPRHRHRNDIDPRVTGRALMRYLSPLRGSPEARPPLRSPGCNPAAQFQGTQGFSVALAAQRSRGRCDQRIGNLDDRAAWRLNGRAALFKRIHICFHWQTPQLSRKRFESRTSSTRDCAELMLVARVTLYRPTFNASVSNPT